MKYALHISSRAEADIAAAYDWYQERSAGLGVDFVSSIETTIALAQHSPQVFRIRHGSHRLAMTRRFPYAVYFIWDETIGIVSIRRILHFAQNPIGQL